MIAMRGTESGEEKIIRNLQTTSGIIEWGALLLKPILINNHGPSVFFAFDDGKWPHKVHAPDVKEFTKLGWNFVASSRLKCVLMTLHPKTAPKANRLHRYISSNGSFQTGRNSRIEALG
ncbi:hypothetical protein Tco_0840844 [Tanacetum coccineum]|uniref:Uncharacterized protein n=1 Tax=Tanacetum coccineum TaxID=301880 RepID=A0ABQ5AXF7_9ASTR